MKEMEKKLEDRKKEIKEVEDQLGKRLKDMEGPRGGGGGVGTTAVKDNAGHEEKQRYIVITNSNGQDATPNSISNHIPWDKRGKMEISVVVAYTLDVAFRRVDQGEINVRGATVVIDDLTNDVQGTQLRPAVSPQQLVRLVDRLRSRVMEAGAAAFVICQLKLMQFTDVTPYNTLLNDYLRSERHQGRGGHGCRTQIRLDNLKSDGYHVVPQLDSTIDRTYACAFLGIPVPCPTPWDEFVPLHVRRRWETEWPSLVGGGASMANNGR